MSVIVIATSVKLVLLSLIENAGLYGCPEVKRDRQSDGESDTKRSDGALNYSNGSIYKLARKQGVAAQGPAYLVGWL